MLITLVPHTHVEDASGDEPTVHDAEEETGGKEPAEILGDTNENTNGTPHEGERR